MVIFPWWFRWLRIHLQCGRPGFDPWVGKIPPEEGIATYSGILAWRIPMDSGCLHSMGPQRVGLKHSAAQHRPCVFPETASFPVLTHFHD